MWHCDKCGRLVTLIWVDCVTCRYGLTNREYGRNTMADRTRRAHEGLPPRPLASDSSTTVPTSGWSSW